MPSLADAIRAVVGGASGNVNDGLKAYYAANGGVGTNLLDLERSYLISQLSLTAPVAATTNDLWKQLLVSFTGSFPDQLLQFWLAGGSAAPSAESVIQAIFDGGALGSWLSADDLPRMRKNTLGTSAVTTTGDQVSVMFDRKQPNTLGAEENLDLNFNTPSAWATGGTGWVISGGLASHTGIGEYLLPSPKATAVIGAFYQYVLDVTTADASNYFQTYCGDSGETGLVQTTGLYSPIQRATGNALGHSLRALGTVAATSWSVKRIAGNHANQYTLAKRPAYRTNSGKPYIDCDGVDDDLTIRFTAPLGSSCTVCRANPGVGAVILTGQTVGTDHVINTDFAAYIIFNRALTGPETASVTAYLNDKAGV